MPTVTKEPDLPAGKNLRTEKLTRSGGFAPGLNRWACTEPGAAGEWVLASETHPEGELWKVSV